MGTMMIRASNLVDSWSPNEFILCVLDYWITQVFSNRLASVGKGSEPKTKDREEDNNVSQPDWLVWILACFWHNHCFTLFVLSLYYIYKLNKVAQRWSVRLKVGRTWVRSQVQATLFIFFSFSRSHASLPHTPSIHPQCMSTGCPASQI